MFFLTLFILAANVTCYLLLGLLHLWPRLVPEHHHPRLIGLLYLLIGLMIAAKQWPGK